MLLRQKIILGSLLLSLMISALLAVGLLELLKIRDEIRSMSATSAVRTISLQVRRQEKRYFLYGTEEELERHRRYVASLKALLGQAETPAFQSFREIFEEYEEQFLSVVSVGGEIKRAISIRAALYPAEASLLEYVDSTKFANPEVSAQLLTRRLGLPGDSTIVAALLDLNVRMGRLDEALEGFNQKQKEMEAASLQHVEHISGDIDFGLMALVPAALVIGLGLTVSLSSNVTHRLRMLSEEIEKKGRVVGLRSAGSPAAPEGADEIDMMLDRYKALESELARREADLLESKKLSAMGTLAAGVAHELNNPLSNICTTAQRLAKKAGSEAPPHLRQGLEDIFDQSLRVKKIIGDLLEFARTREPDLREVDAFSVARHAYESLGVAMDRGSSRLVVEGQGPLMVYADPLQLEQVMINLFANAVEAMGPEGGTITLSGQRFGGLVRLEVRDTGPGLGAESKERLFDPFFSTKEKGTGLGLSIVYSIVQRNGGRISAADAPGGGAVFTLELPAPPEGQATL